jgi:hypothetical protein
MKSAQGSGRVVIEAVLDEWQLLYLMPRVIIENKSRTYSIELAVVVGAS